MGYRALDIANYIVYYALNKEEPIDHLQLQKNLYYLEAISLIKKDESLIDDDIEMWRLGPVIPSVYHVYKIFGSGSIISIPKEIKFKINSKTLLEFVQFNPEIIPSELKDQINPYIDRLLKHDGFELVDKTHKHSLWKEYESQINSGEKGLKYNKEEMKVFFENNPDELEFIQ